MIRDKAKILALTGASGLLVVSLIALGLVLWGVKRDLDTVTDQRDALTAWAGKVCVAVGKSFDDPEACLREVVRLVNFERQAERQTAEALTKAAKDAADKQSRDLTAARRDAARAREAKARMEKIDVPPTNDVGGEFFAALNDLAGLRP